MNDAPNQSSTGSNTLREVIAGIVDPTAKFQDIEGVQWSRFELERRELAYRKADSILGILPAAQAEPRRGKKWYLASMNDGLFIIDAPPRPSNDDVWPDRPDGPNIVLNITELPAHKAALLVDAMNAVPQPASNAYTWQDISTAPKQVGKHLRMFGSGSNIHECEFIGVWHDYSGVGGWVEAYSERRVEPTHWMEIGPSPLVPSTNSGDAA